jgi:hypothetical protein
MTCLSAHTPNKVDFDRDSSVQPPLDCGLAAATLLG